MRLFSKVVVILTLGGVMLGLFAAPVMGKENTSPKDSLAFDILFSKTVFKVDEPVTCKLVLTNNGKTPLIVNGRFLVNQPFPNPHEVYFEITDESGKYLFFQLLVRAGEPTAGDFKTLAPGKKLLSTDYMGIVETGGENLSQMYGMTKPGVYRVRAVYENRAEPKGMTVWKGKLYSPTVTVTIKK